MEYTSGALPPIEKNTATRRANWAQLAPQPYFIKNTTQDLRYLLAPTKLYLLFLVPVVTVITFISKLIQLSSKLDVYVQFYETRDGAL